MLLLLIKKRELLPEWEKRISRGGGFKLTLKHTVCELHFEKHFIKTSEDLVIDGKLVQIPLEKKRLTHDAVPTIFEKYPSYKNTKPPLKRKNPSERKNFEPSSCKSRKIEPDPLSESEFQDNIIGAEIDKETDFPCDEPLSLMDSILKDPDIIQRPNENWHIHRGPNFLSFVRISDNIQIDRFVKIIYGSTEPQICLWQKRIFESYLVTTPENFNELLVKLDALTPCPGTNHDNYPRSDKCSLYLAPSGRKQKPPPRCLQCSLKRRTLAKGIKRQLNVRVARVKIQRKNLARRQEKAKLRRKVVRRDTKIQILEKKINSVMEELSAIKEEQIHKYIQDMPQKWQQVILSCAKAAKAKTPNGRRYTLHWIYECQMLRIKSLALYKKMLRDRFLPLPSLRTLQRYMSKLKPAYGFQENTFQMLKEKAPHMTDAQKQCSLLVDEMKLSEDLWVDKSSLKDLSLWINSLLRDKKISCLNYDDPRIPRSLCSDHICSPDKRRCEGLTEEAGFFVNAVVTDAASWNRNMWSQFGLKKLEYEKQGSKKKYTIDDEDNYNDDDDDENFEFELAYPIRKNNTQKKTTKKSKSSSRSRKTKKISQEVSSDENSEASCVHPLDDRRRLWFVSDFPHLIKSVKQRIVNAEEIETPDGKVKLNHWVIVVREDDKKGIKVAPKLSNAHFQSESFAAMSVKLAFSVATAMLHYKRHGVLGMEDSEATVKFIRRINVLIDAMNSNTSKFGLKDEGQEDDVLADPPVCLQCQKTHDENTPQRKKSSREVMVILNYDIEGGQDDSEVITDFLAYLKTWETSKISRDKRLTASAAHGLRVTLTSALEVSLYMIRNFDYQYFMTRRLNQDPLEHFFGEIRQGCGAHGHPDPWQFIQVYRLMSYKNLVKPPRGSNVTGEEMLSALLTMPDLKSQENMRRQIELEKKIDEALDTGEVLSSPFGDHTYFENLTIDPGAIRFFGGYVARKLRRSTCAKTCQDCFKCLVAPQTQPLHEDDDIIHGRSQGFLLTPSNELMAIIEQLETAILEVYQVSHLHEDLIFEVADSVKDKKFVEIGCNHHKRELTRALLSFYMTTRLIFACEDYNKRLSENAKKKSKAKHLQKMHRLTC
ncbi:LOW QUALITY PROTEIN: Transposable element P transposase [Frankliniella fusca]|uniref:Transposable element P transposase n=1 Tax=Frankliniella fusca TaxID=407009 RepID=A0AAE1HDF6_9NEOP|nr:LOW QUALITY PROTEIN: Transposable element P transposase [Frankliniella fusca]